jgi:hypothetical protein
MDYPASSESGEEPKTTIVTTSRQSKHKYTCSRRPSSERTIHNHTVATKIHPHDVLLGKGSFSYRNPGNVIFREIIRNRRIEYTDTSRRRDKAIIAKQIVASVQSNGGNFLQQNNDYALSEVDNDCQNTSNRIKNLIWIVVDDATALAKVKQALRDCQNRQKQLHRTIDRQGIHPRLPSQTSAVIDVQQSSENHTRNYNDVVGNLNNNASRAIAPASPSLPNLLSLLNNNISTYHQPHSLLTEYAEMRLLTLLASWNLRSTLSNSRSLEHQHSHCLHRQNFLIPPRIQQHILTTGTRNEIFPSHNNIPTAATDVDQILRSLLACPNNEILYSSSNHHPEIINFARNILQSAQARSHFSTSIPTIPQP